MNPKKLLHALAGNDLDENFGSVCDNESIGIAKKRFGNLIEEAFKKNPETDVRLFSTPGRTELGGNHTDHNHGRVLAGCVNLDTIAAASPSGKPVIEIRSEGFKNPIIVDLSELDPVSAEQGKPEAIVRGIASCFKEKGYAIGGFTAFVSSTVPLGGGLSSSASFEVLIATILNAMYNREIVPLTEIALICQYAENRFFGKPCGLMDQLTCSLGGIVAIDFADSQSPGIERLDFDFGSYGMGLVMVETGGHHADLTHEYAAIPEEMKRVARALGKEYLNQVDYQALIQAIPVIRSETGDRALVRALHFLGETQRVIKQVDALREKDLTGFLSLVKESGSSSWRLLQNCYPMSSPEKQPICLALALTEYFLGNHGAFRVHGSGFGGAIQAYIPYSKLDLFNGLIEPIFGKGSVTVLSIREKGTTRLL